MQQKVWHSSIGYTLTALPQDITEEIQLQAPTFDYHVLRKLSKNFYLDGRINFQFVQSHLSIGPRWAHIINDRLSFSVGDDIAWWYGLLNISDFKTKANGWLNYPNASVGIRLKKQILLTLKGETLLNLHYQTKIASDITETHTYQNSGFAGSIILEQPFFKKKNITTGFRAQYSNFFWQTWPLFETFDRKIFYPEIIVGFIL